MAEKERSYIAIDLKSFYASVELRERQLNPLKTHLVVADASRTNKTICLAVSPSLKAYGIPGRPRLFEVVRRVEDINRARLAKAPGNRFSGSSDNEDALAADPSLALDYLTAPPRMALYMAYSAKICSIYMRYVAPEDLHVYSIDEVMIDATAYLNTYKMSARELARKMIADVLKETGITATAGIGTNLYLAKVAMDIIAKHIPADEDGVRIASLDEMSYRRLLWDHRPITDFWRVGRGYAKKLADHGMYTMGDVARCSAGPEGAYQSEALLYDLFGINAELLIDHAWGWEPCSIEDIRAYQPENKCISSGQVLMCPYDTDGARLIVREMTELVVLELVEKGLLTDQLVLTLNYDISNLTASGGEAYRGEVVTDHYGRRMPAHAHGTENLGEMTSSTRKIVDHMMALFDRIVNRKLTVRRITVTVNHLTEAAAQAAEGSFRQLDLFTDPAREEAARRQEEKERAAQKAVLDIRNRFGKNAILKGMNLEKGATTIKRNEQIGGHKA